MGCGRGMVGLTGTHLIRTETKANQPMINAWRNWYAQPPRVLILCGPVRCTKIIALNPVCGRPHDPGNETGTDPLK